LNRTLVIQELRENIGKWDFKILKSFYTAKVIVTILEIHPSEWDENLCQLLNCKESMTRIQRELKELTSQRIEQKNFKEVVQMANKCEEVLNILGHKKMKIKTMLSFHLTVV
jgi:hypothetical protein